MPSASSLQIGMTCPGSVSLPWVGSERSSDANLGTKLHACIEAYYDIGANEAERVSIEEECHAEWMIISKSVFPVLTDVKTEHYFEYNPATSVVNHLGKEAYDKYSKEYCWIRGCADIVGRTESGVLFVGDWKTGFGLAPPSENNWQLIVTALAFIEPSDDRVVGRIIRTKDSTFDEHVYTREFLLQKSDELVDFAMSIQEGTNKDKLKTGEHCKYCKSWVFCPAQKTAIERCAYVKELSKVNPLDDCLVEGAIEQVRGMEELAKKAKQKIREYIELKGGELRLSDGRVLVPAKTDGNYVRKR